MIINNLFDLLQGNYNTGGDWSIKLLDVDPINMKVNGVSGLYSQGDFVSSDNSVSIEFEDLKDNYIVFEYVVFCAGSRAPDVSQVPVIIQQSPAPYKKVNYYSDYVKAVNYELYYLSGPSAIRLVTFNVEGNELLPNIPYSLEGPGLINSPNPSYAYNLVNTLNNLVTQSSIYTDSDIKFYSPTTLTDCDGLPSFFGICWKVQNFRIEISPGLLGYGDTNFPAGSNWSKTIYTNNGIQLYNSQAGIPFNYVSSNHNNPSCSGFPNYVARSSEGFATQLTGC